jgi:hypothetical protein
MDTLAVATIILAVFTAILAVATVFGREIRGWLIHPRLMLFGRIDAKYVVRSPAGWLANMEPPGPAPTPGGINVPAGERAPWYWVRMEITNGAERSEPAENVEIFVDQIQKRSNAGVFSALPNVGRNLCWLWGEDTILTNILPGASKFFDLGHVVHPSGRQDFPDYLATPNAQTRSFLTLASYPRNPGYEAIFEPGTYRMRLNVGGKNFSTITKWIQFGFDDDWTPYENIMLGMLSLEIEE